MLTRPLLVTKPMAIFQDDQRPFILVSSDDCEKLVEELEDAGL